MQSAPTLLPLQAVQLACTSAARWRSGKSPAAAAAAAAPPPPQLSDPFPVTARCIVAARVRPLSRREQEWQPGRTPITAVDAAAHSLTIHNPSDEDHEAQRTAKEQQKQQEEAAAAAAASALRPGPSSARTAHLPLIHFPRGAGWQPPTRATGHQATISLAASADASAASSRSEYSADFASAAPSAPSAPASAEPAPCDRTPPAPRSFSFDRAYGSDDTNAQLYGDLIRPLLPGVMDGFGATVLAYGSAGAGKTFSLSGVPDAHPDLEGLMPRALRDIFAAIDPPRDGAAAAPSCLDHSMCVVRVSCVELYLDRVSDLLSKDAPRHPPLDIRELPAGPHTSVVFIKDLSWIRVVSLAHALDIIRLTHTRSRVGSTLMGRASSRATVIYRWRVERKVPAPMAPVDATLSAEADAAAASLSSASSSPLPPRSDALQVGHLTFVDLAMSNRETRSGASEDRLREATRIGLSLAPLGNVIAALTNPKASHVPYRDSKVTRLLQGALGGTDRTVWIAHLSPSALQFDESLSTLRYATRARAVVTQPTRAFDPDPDPAASLRQWDADFADRRRQLIARGRCLLQCSLIWRLPLPRVLIDHVATFVTLGAGQRPDQQIRDPRLQARTNNGAVQEAESAAACALASLPSK